ncbi:DNA-binding transcriptional LysR family regulator [Mycetocola sp. CAN_C7]
MAAKLFTRSVRGTELTDAGRQLLEDAEPLLQSAGQLRDRIAEAAIRMPLITVGFDRGIAVAPIVREFSEQHGAVEVDLMSVEPEDPTELMRSGMVDLCFVRQPIDPRDLQLIPLYEEPRVVAMPADNPLARLDYLEIRDLLQLRLLQDAEAVPELTAFYAPGGHRAQPRRLTRSYSTGSMLEAMERVAARHGIVVLPASMASLYARTDVAYCRVNGLEPSVVVVAFARNSPSRDVLAMVDVAVRQASAVLVG